MNDMERMVEADPALADAAVARVYTRAITDTVVSTIGQAISKALNEAALGFYGKTFRGWVDPEKLKKPILEGEYRVSVYLRPESRNVPTRTMVSRRQTVYNGESLTISSQQVGAITFGGSVQPGTAIIFAAGQRSFSYTVSALDSADLTLATLAQNVSAAITAKLGIADAYSMGSMVACYSSPIAARIVRTGSLRSEAQRIERRLQVVVYAPQSDNTHGLGPQIADRSTVVDTILANIGTIDQPTLPLPNGASVWVKYVSDFPADKPQVDYDLYMHHIFFTAEYGIPRITRAVSLEAVDYAAAVAAPNLAAPTSSDTVIATDLVISQPVAPYGVGENI